MMTDDCILYLEQDRAIGCRNYQIEWRHLLCMMKVNNVNMNMNVIYLTFD